MNPRYPQGCKGDRHDLCDGRRWVDRGQFGEPRTMPCACHCHEREWRLWNPDPGDPSYSANFYTPTAPYLRRKVTVTHLSLAGWAEKKERDRGYVTLPELSPEAIAYWAESDASQIAYLLCGYVAAESIKKGAPEGTPKP